MSLEITGKLVRVLPEQTGSGRNGQWLKQEFVIETNEQFPKKICCVAWGERADDLKQFNPGDDLKVYINIESREYNDRWYTDVKAWKIEASQGGSSSGSGSGSTTTTNYSSPSRQQAPPPANDFVVEHDDLPF